MRSLRGGRARRLACAAAALLLGGCATLAQRHIEVRPLTPNDFGSVVLLRVTDPAGGPARAAMLADAEFAVFGSPASRYAPNQAGSELGVAPSYAAGTQGWVNLAMVPGRHVLRLRPAGARGAEGDALFSFDVPSRGGVTYIGTFRRDCAPPRADGCRIASEAVDETDAATAMLARENPAAGPPRRALARPYPPSLAALGLVAPGAADLRVNASAWQQALDWHALTESERPPREGPAAPRSDAWPELAGPLRSVSMEFSGSGGAAALIALPAAIVVAVPIALVVRGIMLDAERRRAADAAEWAEAAAQARERWGACLAGMAATLAPQAVERHLRASPLQATGGTPWRAEVSRLLLRPCGPDGENRYGLEVTTRWTARRGGEDAPGYDAAFTRGVAGATLDRRVRHARRAPWDLPTASEASCRPLAAWCGDEGSARLLEEVTRGVAEARDAIAAGR